MLTSICKDCAAFFAAIKALFTNILVAVCVGVFVRERKDNGRQLGGADVLQVNARIGLQGYPERWRVGGGVPAYPYGIVVKAANYFVIKVQ